MFLPKLLLLNPMDHFASREKLICVFKNFLAFCSLSCFCISLGNMSSSPDRCSSTLRMIDFIKIPRESGDSVVLLLFHPGVNLLGRYLPPVKVNDLLLADSNRTRPSSAHGDVYMMEPGEPGLTEEMEGFDIMDLASFIEQGFCFLEFDLCLNACHRFAIQATHCLEVLNQYASPSLCQSNADILQSWDSPS